jgi:esterase/lipase
MKLINKAFFTLVLIISLGICSVPIAAETKVGVVLLHGNGHPTALIEGLISKLEAHNFLVAHPEIPYSEDQRYDKDVDSAIKQVDAAFASLKAKGANRLFIAGHSKGGVFALYYATKHPVDGLIAIKPGASR